jgi:hypothetical protein
LNIDGCRVRYEEGGTIASNPLLRKESGAKIRYGLDKSPTSFALKTKEGGMQINNAGRWPANLVLNHLPDCIASGSKTVKANGHAYGPANRNKGGISTTGHSGQTGLVESVNREENVPAWACQAQCPVERLDKQSGLLTSNIRQPTYKPIMNSTGGASMNWNQNNVMDTTERGFKDAGGASRFFQQVEIP